MGVGGASFGAPPPLSYTPPIRYTAAMATPTLALPSVGRRSTGGVSGRNVPSTSSTSATRITPGIARQRIIPMTHLNPAPATGTLRGNGPMPAGGR